jgi:GNAT superfamily N-acetyltransferase
MPIDVRRIPADSPDALELLGAMVDELSAHYGDTVAEHTPSAVPQDLSPPGGCFLALYADGRPLAGGGIKRLDPDTGEVKRMFVVPGARGRGLSRVLLTALEDAARSLGYRRVRLDTGPKQTAARALDETAGYASIGDYNANTYASYWGEKTL